MKNVRHLKSTFTRIQKDGWGARERERDEFTGDIFRAKFRDEMKI